MINKKGTPLRLVGSERPKPGSATDKEGDNKKVSQPEVVSDWEDEGGRLDRPKNKPDSDSPARGT